ncbi:MAG: tail fiber protein [Desulfovibrio sp.]|jgi:microcystin-dependent protein|nr:tail fiber protein [Desulfovibrio sp.]
MTIVSTNTVELYTGNGTQTEWPVTFPFLRSEDVRAVVSGTGGDRVLAYGTDYVAAALPGGGGSVSTAPGTSGMVGAGEHLTLWLDQPFTQEMDLRNTGVLDAEMLERGFDRLTLMAQQLREEVGRCVKVPLTDQSTRPDALLEGITANVGRAELAALDAQGQAASATASAARAESAFISADVTLTGVQQLHGEVAQAVADARQDVLASAAFVPIGAILDFPVNTVPAGFLVCAGQVVTRAAYPDLVTYLTGGTVALSAVLPDLRGEFRRGADLGRGVDAGRVVGSFQADTLKAHTHAYSRFIASASLQRGAGSVNTGGYDSPETSATGDAETRPRNIAVVVCIKAYHAPGTAVPVDVAGVMGRLDAMAAVVSPNVGRFCTVYPNNSTQQSLSANATTVVSNNGAQASIGENWPGAGDGSLSIVIPEDGVYELTAVVALYSGAVSSVAWGWITVNGSTVLESVDYCQMVIQDALQLRAVRQLAAGTVVRVTVRPSTLAAGGSAAANNLTVMRVR